ncbi:hypothetical protein A2866_04590 [Candidatus Roizmanbacteria bacterium RIFCSPHIGHO2_01_FULL_39_8]|uniref:Xaa-Pro dipeptidase n=3 Tax=Candidatus Roizmaniibacteriota TaxID=1752723 RepID=A0A1F7GSU5_9BACT|nr:MAG: hypothetical protein A2866_04590 [Candidatus Roizmanbacteria bacterium RIFCSPHIGHO2_01_FULL_39_8]OGK28001.1 MAG: hypothetical protein A3C28_02730 [Candidatus Roizmanbacteria bacterium RIFCSPHIGHO2_02_FULL_39_9]OGK35711.1 MAG: hypothetical protein A3F60_00895 [Candidatus Roizmanbacteria bacterium RIFCSPHIGHO2_12_FULL_39_8]
MYVERIERVKTYLLGKKIDALLVSNFYNILYLTGFKTLTTDEREAFVLITQNKLYLFSDERYLSKNYKLPTTNYELRLIEPKRGLLVHLKEIVGKEKIKTLGFEAEDLKYYEHFHISQQLAETKLMPTDRTLVKLREIKDEREIALIEKACKITDKCLEDTSKIVKVGVSEKELAFKLEVWLREKGYDLAFDPIVAVDENSAIAHYNTKTGEGIVKKNSVILVDFGVKYKDYLSDITRMIFFGKPTDGITVAYENLLTAQKKTIEKVTVSRKLREPDLFCRETLTARGYPNYPHSTGHGVGLEIHEYPKVSFTSEDDKKIGQVITIEPGVYFSGKWGMRIEDTVVIDDDLTARTLTKYPKEIQII